MKVVFCPVWIEPGVEFEFSLGFWAYLRESVGALLKPSEAFIAKYEEEFALVFYISAKNEIVENEIRGPGVFRKTKEVEYTIFLPFDFIVKTKESCKTAVRLLLDGICEVCSRLKIDASVLADQKEAILANPDMVKPPAEQGKAE